MEFIWEGIRQAFLLLIHGDPDVWEITLLSIEVSGIATGISLLLGLPLGTWIALGKFPGRNFTLSLINTGMALPPVVVGLWVSIFMWRSGPLGDMHLIYTPTAIIVAQTIISAPVVTGLTVAALQSLNPRLQLQLLGLGASRMQLIVALWREARLPLLAALMAGFGSVISEVGASMMVGGNILHYTRNIPTAIALETSKGAFAQGIALGIVLLLAALVLNFSLSFIQGKGEMAQ